MGPPRLLAAAVALLAACAGEVTASPGQNTPAQNQAAVEVIPKSASVAPGASYAFAAQVTGTANIGVDWSVQEGAPGGSVTAVGLYTAPQASGAYHVVATSKGDPSKSGSASVTVATTTHGFGGSMKLGTNFWDPAWGIWGDIFKAGVQPTTIANTPDPWNPVFLDEVRRYQVLRFMDFAQTNYNTERTWSQRTPKTGTAGSYRLAWEWMIDLCNRTNADLWINVPTYADDDYAFQLATLIGAGLNGSLRVFVEWSNETWNFSDANAEECRIGQQVVPGDAAACAKGYVARSVRIFKQFERVFGSNNPRLVKVLSGQAVNASLTTVHLRALQDPVINPDHLSATAYAVAPYFGYYVNGAAANALSSLSTAISSGTDNALDAAKAQARTVAGSGLVLIAYEAGQTVFTGADVVNGNPGMYQVYTDYLNAMAPYFALLVHYLHNGTWSSGGAWGAEQHVGQPLSESHKLRALLDWAAAHP
jgi:hypothetical protein